jgi:hypothetical protein
MILSVTLFSFITNTHGDMSIDMYEKLKKSETDRMFLESYISGLGAGYRWFNSHLESQKSHKPLYCQPEMLSLNQHNFISILDNIINKNKEKAEMKKITSGDTPIEPLLLDGLIETFPCKKE